MFLGASGWYANGTQQLPSLPWSADVPQTDDAPGEGAFRPTVAQHEHLEQLLDATARHRIGLVSHTCMRSRAVRSTQVNGCEYFARFWFGPPRGTVPVGFWSLAVGHRRCQRSETPGEACERVLNASCASFCGDRKGPVSCGSACDLRMLCMHAKAPPPIELNRLCFATALQLQSHIARSLLFVFFCWASAHAFGSMRWSLLRVFGFEQ